MHILLSNFSYGLWVDGSLWWYIRHVHRARFTPKNQYMSLVHLAECIREEDIDIACICEIHQGEQIDILNSLLPDMHIRAHTKYGENFSLSSFFFGEKKSNGVLTRSDYPVSITYFTYGHKKLIYIIDITPEVCLYFAHFSLRKEVRALQFEELEHIIDSSKHTIIAGDFNIFQGIEELQWLCKKFNLEPIMTTPTFPSFRPKYLLDLFLVSKNIQFESQVLSDIFSDHLPVKGILHF